MEVASYGSALRLSICSKCFGENIFPVLMDIAAISEEEYRKMSYEVVNQFIRDKKLKKLLDNPE